jgi:hypothetical protein
MTLVGGQRQADAVYFDVLNAFDLVPHNLLFRKLRSFGFSDGYVSWFCSNGVDKIMETLRNWGIEFILVTLKEF